MIALAIAVAEAMTIALAVATITAMVLAIATALVEAIPSFSDRPSCSLSLSLSPINHHVVALFLDHLVACQVSL